MTQRQSDEAYFAQMEQELRGELEEGYPESWNFKEAGSESIVGVVRQQREATFEREGERQTQKIAVLEVSGGEKRTVWMTKVLLSAFQRERVAIGDMVAIKYEGPRSPEGGGNDYHDFKVVVRKPDGAAADWSDSSQRSGRRATDAPAGTSTSAASDADFQGSDDDIPF